MTGHAAAYAAGLLCGMAAAWLALLAVESAITRGCHLPEAG